MISILHAVYFSLILVITFDLMDKIFIILFLFFNLTFYENYMFKSVSARGGINMKSWKNPIKAGGPETISKPPPLEKKELKE